MQAEDTAFHTGAALIGYSVADVTGAGVALLVTSILLAIVIAGTGD